MRAASHMSRTIPFRKLFGPLSVMNGENGFEMIAIEVVVYSFELGHFQDL